VLDEYYWLNKDDPNFSLCRATENCGPRTPTPTKNSACPTPGAMEIMKLFMTPDEALYNKRIDDVLRRRGAEHQLLAVLAHHVRL
jgi:oleate hydratase